MREKSFWITKTIRLGLVLAWFDMWLGFYYNRGKHRLYCMIPFVGIWVERKQPLDTFAREGDKQ